MGMYYDHESSFDILIWPDGQWCTRENRDDVFPDRDDNYEVIRFSQDPESPYQRFLDAS